MRFTYLANSLHTQSEKGGIFIGRGQLIEPRKNFTIRLSEEEREQAEYDAKTNGMKLSDYIRYLILHGGKVDNGCGYVFDSTMKNGNQLILQIKDLVQEVVCGWR